MWPADIKRSECKVKCMHYLLRAPALSFFPSDSAHGRNNPWKPAHVPMTGTEAALCHLLLETLPPPLCLPSHISDPEVQTAASHLFDTCLERRNARLAVKLAACFGLSTKSDGEREDQSCCEHSGA